MAKAVGKVIRHAFMGDGQMAPVVEYKVGGKGYTCTKKYDAIIKVRGMGIKEPAAWCRVFNLKSLMPKGIRDPFLFDKLMMFSKFTEAVRPERPGG